MKKRELPQDLFNLKPVRNVKWEVGSDNRVVLIIPKFRNRFLVRWFVPMLAKPDFRVTLDAYGSFVWHWCDGERSVAMIADLLGREFNEPPESMVRRTGMFFDRLLREHLITDHGTRNPDGPRT